MIKKSQKSINIENIENKDGGIINFYNDSPIDKNSKKIDIAAVDRYSTPLIANVDMTPFGNKGYFRVSTRVTEKLNNQTIYQKYLTFGSEKKAKETMDFIVGVMEGIKDEAEIELRHSAFLIPRIWSKLSNISDDVDIAYHDGEDASIKLRFNNNQFDGKDNPIPQGFVGEENRSTYTQGVAPNIADIIGAPSQYTNPGRTGVMAKGMNKMIKTSSKQNNNLISKSFENILLKYPLLKRPGINAIRKIIKKELGTLPRGSTLTVNYSGRKIVVYLDAPEGMRWTEGVSSFSYEEYFDENNIFEFINDTVDDIKSRFNYQPITEEFLEIDPDYEDDMKFHMEWDEKEKKDIDKESNYKKIISTSIKNIFSKLINKKQFTNEEAKEIGEEIGIDWEKVEFSVSDFKKGLEVEVEHDDDPQTDVVRDDKRKYDYVGKIAWRHLKESPRYYKELDKMEKKF